MLVQWTGRPMPSLHMQACSKAQGNNSIVHVSTAGRWRHDSSSTPHPSGISVPLMSPLGSSSVCPAQPM